MHIINVFGCCGLKNSLSVPQRPMRYRLCPKSSVNGLSRGTDPMMVDEGRALESDQIQKFSGLKPFDSVMVVW